jgi:hypothetical protein
MTGRLPFALIALSIAALESASAQGRLVATRKNIGDTTLVRVVSGSVWGNTASLVEELRIGALDGAPEETFGQILDVAPDRRGGVYVFDGKAPALRHFDSTGRHVAKLGGRGAGPGEYQDASLGMKVRPDGRVFLRDPRNARLNVYGPDGKPLTQIPITSGLFTGNSMIIDTAGEFYLKILLGPIERNKPWPIGLLHLSSAGKIIDSLRPPTLAGEPAGASGFFAPQKVWEMSPFGYVVGGVNSSYRFEFTKRDGKVIRVEMSHTPVRLAAEERAEYEATNEWTRKYRSQFQTAEIPPTPQTKPAYSGFDIGDDGQIWVRVHVPAVKVQIDDEDKPKDPSQRPVMSWREPATYDVFQPDGTYLGRIRLPDKVSLAAHRGDEVWGRTAGEFGELYLVRYRLKHR